MNSSFDNASFDSRNISASISSSVARCVSQSLYVVAGLACALGNSLVILIICRNKKLHGKIFIFLLSLALADVFKGIGYAVIGSKRLYLLTVDEANFPVTSFDCMKEFGTTMLIVGPQAINLMTIALSADRLIAIACPVLYMRLSRRYAYLCIFSSWSLVLISYSVAWIDSSRLSRPVAYTKWCVVSWSFSRDYNRFMFGFEATSTWICLVLLIVTFFVVRCPPSANIAVIGRPAYYRRQLKLAKMVLISLSFVTILWVLPTNVVFIMTMVGRSKAFDLNLAPILWLMVAFSGCTNVFVYAWMNKRIRAGLKELILRRGKRSHPIGGYGKKSRNARMNSGNVRLVSTGTAHGGSTDSNHENGIEFREISGNPTSTGASISPAAVVPSGLRHT